MKRQINIPSFVGDMDELNIHQQYLIASSKGMLRKIRELIDNEALDHNCCDENGCTALHLAAANGHHEIVEVLAASPKVNINALDNVGRHAMELAWERRSRRTVEIIYKQIRSRHSEKASELGIWVFSQMIFANNEGNNGTVQNQMPTPSNILKQLTKGEQKQIDLESGRYLFREENLEN